MKNELNKNETPLYILTFQENEIKWEKCVTLEHKTNHK